ncbi:MAG: S8 family serine peptidase [Candidatus Thermoplasmatota archaeon]|nr:S8 family serine peptidase [Candidatus Thermoplasmatota archaeon]
MDRSTMGGSADKGVRGTRVALFLLVLMVTGPAAAGSEALLPEAEPRVNVVEGVPPLMCGDELCPAPDRWPDRAERMAEEDYGWWLRYGPDLDGNGMDDRLQRVLDGAPSVSPTAIEGADGRLTVAIVVDFAWHPGEAEVAALRAVLEEHGWVGEEGSAWFDLPESLDSIVLDRVPVSALLDIWRLEGVVVVEMQNVLVPTNDVASKAIRARDSDVYAGEVHPTGLTGAGVVIAVLDTGVDNEHRSLNDFDDSSDAPDLDPLSYDDHKWVAGFDATSTSSNPDGSQDPDDGQGHGTHVAGSALGTGDASRQHMGTAPGAYLVDVKVLTDAGGTNSQYSISGIQWVVNNANTDWGHNGSSKGIQVASMSFGSFSSPLNPDDTGDNGSSAEARQVNNAVDAGVVCVIAMGNDGARRVPSPASADKGIAISAANDRGTINRTDDSTASYTNYGPRDDDGDGDDLDELKPDLASFGTGITSATAATGTTFPGQPDRPKADSGYDSKDGTSMATPLASGVVALMLEADSSLEPDEIKQLLHDSAERRGSASEPSIDPHWNDKWGWGLIDASCAVDLVLERTCTALDGGTVVVQPPVGDGDGNHVDISSHQNGSLLLAGDRVRFQGSVEDTDDRTYTEVEVRMEQYRDGSSNPVELLDWRKAGGEPASWYLDVTLSDDWVDEDEDYTLLLARARTASGDVSATNLRVMNIGRMAASITSPSTQTVLDGSVTFSGTAQGPEPSVVEGRIGNGPWVEVATLNDEDFKLQDWTWTWDSTEVEDGDHYVAVRFVNQSGAVSEPFRRTYEVDNLPAAPELALTGLSSVYDQGLITTSAVAGTILEVRFEFLNDGDATAENVGLVLDAPGSVSEVYPSQGLIASVEAGERRTYSLWWWATEPGTHEVVVTIDPEERLSDVDRSDNEVRFTFTIEPRPVEPSLRFLQGAVTTMPLVPVPNQPFELSVRLDNLGQTEATSLTMNLERWTEEGWLSVESASIGRVNGGSSSSGYATARFLDQVSGVGGHQYRVLLSGNGVEAEHAEHRFTVVADTFTLGSPIRLTLDDGETPIELIGGDDGAILLTTRDGELHARILSSSMVVISDVLVERNWGGEVASTVRSDAMVQLAWTRRTMSEDGYTLQDLGIAALTTSGQMTPVQRELTPLKLSEGGYWGLDVAERNGEVVVAGYHRDISTGGSWLDVTSIFTMISERPDLSGSWDGPFIVHSDVEVLASQGDPVSVAISEERLHILFQTERDDITGVERLGVLYSHGERDQEGWNFIAPVGDNASDHHLSVDEDGQLIAAWIERQGQDAQVCTAVTDQGWSIDAPTCLEAPGALSLSTIEREHGVMVMYDEISVRGPVVRFGLLAVGEGTEAYALANILETGQLLSAGGESADVVVGFVSTTGALDIRILADANPSDPGGNDATWLDDLLAPLPGDRDMQMLILGGSGLVVVVLLLAMVLTARRALRRRPEDSDGVEKELDEDVVMMITPEDDETPFAVVEEEETIVAVMDDEDEEVEEEETVRPDPVNARQERRRRRALAGSLPKPEETLALSAPPLPDLADLPPPSLADAPLPSLPALPDLPPPSREANCASCEASFTVRDLRLRSVPCPICGENVEV